LENLKGRDHLEFGSIKLDIMAVRWEVVDWIHMAQERDQWRNLVKTVMDLRVLEKAEDFSTS
jgi:hypothetical protein